MQSVYRFQALGVNRRLSVVKGKKNLKKVLRQKSFSKKTKEKRSPKPGLVATTIGRSYLNVNCVSYRTKKKRKDYLRFPDNSAHYLAPT